MKFMKNDTILDKDKKENLDQLGPSCMRLMETKAPLKPRKWFVLLSLAGVATVAVLACTVKAILWVFK